ncbi:hypothetical protein SAMN05444156_1948 [Verrucomicrobium sp. GAS474]|uniref:hypothetical protein n=1 Tax=Verrucomicrobium sp. GAS474 TaxID=1882831 RepID=UPI00087AF721|nr:hypothetical protein [Verrucomicrobium sp. GAS474]SDU09896.1 hypothetical protein SAMN05444156_1948 [Verrucomicrobium sp. GAS474]
MGSTLFYVAAVLLLLWTGWTRLRKERPWSGWLLSYPILVSVLSGLWVAGQVRDSIIRSTSSTAAVGYAFLPIWAGSAAIIGWVVTAVFLEALLAAPWRGRWSHAAGILAVAGAAALLLCGYRFLEYKDREASRLVTLAAVQEARSSSLQPNDLSRLLGRAKATHDSDLILALAENPALTNGTANLFMYVRDVPDSDPKKILILQALARNPATPEYYLEPLTKDRNPAIRDAALESLRLRKGR